MMRTTRFMMALAITYWGSINAVAQEWDHEYIPFVEQGKVWNYTAITPKEGLIGDIDCAFTISGDTLIGGNNYKKVFCQFKIYYGDEEQHYYCAVREESYRVYVIEVEENVEKLLCDFSHPQEELFLSYDDCKFARGSGYHDKYIRTGQLNFGLYRTFDDKIDYNYCIGDWIEGVGTVYANPFSREFLDENTSFGICLDLISCVNEGRSLYDYRWFIVPNEKCVTPTIAYDKDKLLFSCETPGAECVYEIKCSDASNGRGGEVSLSQTYEIRVHATLDGYEDSDVAVATIGWRNGRPVMEGFSSVTMDGGDGNADVNGDGKVDVADIATVISVMAGQLPE